MVCVSAMISAHDPITSWMIAMKRFVIVLCVLMGLWGFMFSGCSQHRPENPVIRFWHQSGIGDYVHDVTHPRLSLKTQFKLWRMSRRVHKTMYRWSKDLDTRLHDLADALPI